MKAGSTPLAPAGRTKVSLIHLPSTAMVFSLTSARRNNAFDLHVQQVEPHQRMLTYVSDAITGLLRDIERLGRADDVVLMAFSKFDRRLPENANLGTDHGTAGPMFIAGKPVRGSQ